MAAESKPDSIADLASNMSAGYDVLSLCNEGVLIVAAQEPDFPVLHANPAFCRLSGYDLSELVGKSAALLRSREQYRSLPSILSTALADGREQRLLLRSLHRDDSEFWNQMTVAPLQSGADGKPARLVCIANDVSEQHKQKAQLRQLISHDQLTGLPNRTLFNDQLREVKGRAALRGDTLAVICLSLDSFSLVNESLGHVASDEFVVAVSRRLRNCLGAGNTLARHGGNEFVMVLGEIASAADVTRICAHIVRALAAPVDVAGQAWNVPCSIGIARYPQDADDGVDLLRYADLALAHARDLGGNGYQFFAPEMHQRNAERIQMGAALRVALAQDQLHLQYQPAAEMQQGAVCALEALVRWRHPVDGLIDAHRFIAVAEATGMTTAIGHWALRRACQDMRAWRDAGLAPVRVALNVSPKQLRDASLPHMVIETLQEFDLPSELLAFEVTEAALMQDRQASSDILAQLKGMGVGLTLDDFGTGYSSLNHLKHFPIDLVKIHRNLTASVIAGSDEAELVKTIIAMGHHLGIQVAAVGVETEAQCDFLRRNMCDQVQGYFFAPPFSAADVVAKQVPGLQLPAHLLRIQQLKRTLLLVDDEPNIVSAVKRLLRRDNYQVLTATSGREGLEVLAANKVDVIVSDQRMPGMIGADFLRACKGLYPDTIRIMLSGYTELQSVTDAVNEGAIYKFLTKPWDDDQLRGHIAEAFRLKEIADDNERLHLELRTANYALASANRKMEDLLRAKQIQITRDEISLNVARELLQFVPLAVIGLDDEGMVAFVNGAAEQVFSHSGAMLGNEASVVLPELFPDGRTPAGTLETTIGGCRYQVVAHAMGANSTSRGSLLTVCPCEAKL